ncbi:MAG: NAD(+)/NADH kinase [Eubacterium sp.]|nr:NAD(+)/NADH kinase [Eubacterium sp.]
MDNIVILFDEKKEPGQETANEIKRYLENEVGSVRIVSDAAEVARGGADIVLVLGGDGTVIQAAKQVAGKNIPILGINFGTLGFLTEVERPRLHHALDALLKGNYERETRMALTCQIRQGDATRTVGPVINEFVVCKQDFGHMVTTSVYVDDNYVDTYAADGILISTPTGSTAYNLSAQGPILAPDMEALIITPICPHSLSKKPLIVSSTCTIRLLIDRTKAAFSDSAAIRGDGLLLGEATTGDQFIIRKSSDSFDMIHIGEVNFFDKMRVKLG